MIQVTPAIAIDESELRFDFVRSSGPGGQNVNKVSTAVQLKFNISDSPNLPPGVKHKMLTLGGSRVTRDGVIILKAYQQRSQERNRGDAVNRLIELIREAAKQPTPRKGTKPSFASKQKRLETKKHKSKIKDLRRSVKLPPE